MLDRQGIEYGTKRYGISRRGSKLVVTSSRVCTRAIVGFNHDIVAHGESTGAICHVALHAYAAPEAKVGII